MHDFCIPERDQYKSVVSDELIDLRRNPRLISMKSLWALILKCDQLSKIGFATSLRKQPSLVFPRNDVCETSAEIPYWRRVPTQIWVVLPTAFSGYFPIPYPTPRCFFFFLLTSHAEWTFHKWPTVSNHRILAFRRLFTEGSTVVKKNHRAKQNRRWSFQPIAPPLPRKKSKKKQKRPGVFRLVTTGSNIFLDLPHDKSLDLL